MEPEIVNNNDGTSTFTYRYKTIKLEVLKDNKNHNVVNAKCTQIQEEWLNIYFREDQSLDKIQYNDLSTGNKILIKTNPKDNNKIVAIQYCPSKESDFAIARKYERQKDRTLKLVSVSSFIK